MLALEPRASDDETLESEASIGTADSSENLNVDLEETISDFSGMSFCSKLKKIIVLQLACFHIIRLCSSHPAQALEQSSRLSVGITVKTKCIHANVNIDELGLIMQTK